MFESLTSTMEGFFSKLRRQPRLSERNIRDGLREVRIALLEADVHYRVVKQFIENVTEKAVGEAVIGGIDPAQQIVKIVHDEIEALIGPVEHSIPLRKDGVTVLMLAGLQGSGKTTTAAKLAMHLRERYSCEPVLVAADVERPAAIDQLEQLGRELGIPVISDRQADATMVCIEGRLTAATENRGPVILDTAGRLHIDKAMMDELCRIKEKVRPDQIYYVCDAMMGQDAVVSGQEFDRRLQFDAVILTKLDGDARGGAALSIKAVTGKPIKFVGVGEKLDKFEEFHPDRMADRILGMGDVVSLVEKAQEAATAEDAARLEERIRKATFDLEDFRRQIGMIRNMGPIREILSYVPVLGSKLSQLDFDEREIDRVEGMINAMTPEERTRPEIISAGRRQRIARGSGMDPVQVGRLLKQFRTMKKMMRKVSRQGPAALGNMVPDALGEAGPFIPEKLGRVSKKKSRRKK